MPNPCLFQEIAVFSIVNGLYKKINHLSVKGRD